MSDLYRLLVLGPPALAVGFGLAGLIVLGAAKALAWLAGPPVQPRTTASVDATDAAKAANAWTKAKHDR